MPEICQEKRETLHRHSVWRGDGHNCLELSLWTLQANTSHSF